MINIQQVHFHSRAFRARSSVSGSDCLREWRWKLPVCARGNPHSPHVFDSVRVTRRYNEGKQHLRRSCSRISPAQAPWALVDDAVVRRVEMAWRASCLCGSFARSPCEADVAPCSNNCPDV